MASVASAAARSWTSSPLHAVRPPRGDALDALALPHLGGARPEVPVEVAGLAWVPKCRLPADFGSVLAHLSVSLARVCSTARVRERREHAMVSYA